MRAFTTQTASVTRTATTGQPQSRINSGNSQTLDSSQFSDSILREINLLSQRERQRETGSVCLLEGSASTYFCHRHRYFLVVIVIDIEIVVLGVVTICRKLWTQFNEFLWAFFVSRPWNDFMCCFLKAMCFLLLLVFLLISGLFLSGSCYNKEYVRFICQLIILYTWKYPYRFESLHLFHFMVNFVIDYQMRSLIII